MKENNKSKMPYRKLGWRPKTLSSHVLTYLQDGEKGPSRKYINGSLYFLTSTK